MKTYIEIAEILRSDKNGLSPSQLASLVIDEADGEVSQFYLINAFAEAFPDIPLHQVKKASRWHRVCEDGMSDAEFDSVLAKWISIAAGRDE